jgi:hypothetical protein
VGGAGNQTTGVSSSIAAGVHNIASGPFASVTGGRESTAEGEASSVSGGQKDVASGKSASVSGGTENTAFSPDTSVSGGSKNQAGTDKVFQCGVEHEPNFKPVLCTGEGGQSSAISGGIENKTIATDASVSGGEKNQAGVLQAYYINPVQEENEALASGGAASSVSGGKENITVGAAASVSGGANNRAGELFTNPSEYTIKGEESSVSGGAFNVTADQFGSILGGCGNVTAGANPENGNFYCSFEFAGTMGNTVGGGTANDANGLGVSILGGNGVTLTGSETTSP